MDDRNKMKKTNAMLGNGERPVDAGHLLGAQLELSMAVPMHVA